ncbi:hypothetical protein C8R47DRAFT_1084848 [Mycena vitilis]|nr:hypothetical protein C8R47DRAFT_1084848 [Mycena vitilis]
MTQYTYPAPAAAPTAAGAAPPSDGVHQANAALAALANAVDALTASAFSLVGTQMSELGNAVAGVAAAAETVQQAHAEVFAAFAAGGPLTTPPAFVSALTLAPSSQAAPPTAAPPVQPPAPPSFLRTHGPWLAGYLYSVVPPTSLGAVADNGDKWFAITRGKYVGLTKNSAISLNAVTGVSTGLSEKFSNQVDALAYFNAALATEAVSILV